MRGEYRTGGAATGKKRPGSNHCNKGLARCADVVRRLGVELECDVVDLHAEMTRILSAHPEMKFNPDNIHPDFAGADLMAMLFLETPNQLRAHELLAVDRKLIAHCGEMRVFNQVLDWSKQGGTWNLKDCAPKGWKLELSHCRINSLFHDCGRIWAIGSDTGAWRWRK